MLSRLGARGLAAFGAAGAAAALIVLPAEPAVACSCAPRPVGEILAAGATVAIVSRTDTDHTNGTGQFEVLDGVGPLAAELPTRVAVELDDGGSCRPYVPPGGIAALGASRKNGEWSLSGCGGGLGLGPVLLAATGPPRASGDGSPVAFVAGGFGGGRLAALNANGEVTAWDQPSGSGERVAVCPGGNRVVVAGRTDAADYTDRRSELTVHDAATLSVQRTVRLPVGVSGRVAGLRCTDPAAAGVEALVVDINRGVGRLLTVVGPDVAVTEVAGLRSAVASPTGFVAVLSEGANTQGDARLIALIRGVPRTIVELGEFGVDNAPAVSADGRTVAVFGYPRGNKRNPLLTFDTATGRRLGSWSTADTYVTGMAWSADGRLLVRNEDDYRQDPVALRIFDRNLRGGEPGPAVPGEWAGGLYAVGPDAVSAGGKRFTVTTPSGETLVAEELRLAAANDVAAAEEAAFAVPAVEPSAAVGVAGARFDEAEEDNGSVVAPWILGGTLAFVMLAGAAWLRRP